MLVERTNPFTGKVNSMELNITTEQIDKYQNGELIQYAFPHLTPDEREFIKTGIMPEQWDEMFADEGERADTNGM